MPGLRRLRDPRRDAGLHAGARDREGEDRLRLRDRLRRALPVLHEHVRDALDPRPRAGDRDRPLDVPARPVGLGRDGRRRRALDRRQPPDPRAAPQRQPQDPALQQPDLRPDEGPVLADERAGQGDEVDAVRLARPPLRPAALALGAEATFVARAIDTDKKRADEVLRRAAAHKGTAFVEIYQNCNIFNDGAFDWVREEKENRLYLEQGEPVGDTGLVHDEHDPDPARAMALTYVTMATHGKVPFGVFRDVERPVYDELMAEQIEPRDGEAAGRPRRAAARGRDLAGRVDSAV